MVHFTSVVTSPEKISLGGGLEPRFSLAASPGIYIQAMNGVNIGSNTMLAPGVQLISANHDISGGTSEWLPSSGISIGANCWIGAHAVVLPDVELGDNCIVGAGAVVTKSFPAGSVVGGVPAKLISCASQVSNSGRSDDQHS